MTKRDRDFADVQTRADNAAGVLAKLKRDREALAGRSAEIMQAKMSLAFEATVNGGEAKQKLQALNAELGTLAAQTQDLDTAIAEALRRLKDADATVQAVADRDSARKRLELAKKYRKCGQSADQALKAFCDSYAELLDVSRDLISCGAHHLDTWSTKTSFKRAIQSHLLSVKLHSEVIPPPQRSTVAELTNNWADKIEALARKSINLAESVVADDAKEAA